MARRRLDACQGAPGIAFGAVALLLLMMLAACSSDPAEDGPWAACAEPGADLRLDHIQTLGPRASYHLAQPRPRSKRWAISHAPLAVQLEEQGVRAFDFDVHYGQGGAFRVANRPGVDEGTTCATLRGCLGELRRWSDRNPCHHGLIVRIGNGDDIDADPVADHLAELDAAILAVWPRGRLVTPDQTAAGIGVQGPEDASFAGPYWPTLMATRQRLVVVLSGTNGIRGAYLGLHPALVDAPAFVSGAPGQPGVAVVFATGPDARKWVDKGYLVGVTPAATTKAGQDALASGAHVVFTDAPVPSAVLGGYSLTIPGGKPSRCNPATAPEGCTAAAINGT